MSRTLAAAPKSWSVSGWEGVVLTAWQFGPSLVQGSLCGGHRARKTSKITQPRGTWGLREWGAGQGGGMRCRFSIRLWVSTQVVISG